MSERPPIFQSSAWLDLDRKLDLIGVALVFGAIAILFSALSQEQASISALLDLVSQLVGWGAIALPLTMFALGMWLIVRQFGDRAPTIDPLRLAGAVIAYLSLLVFCQFIEALSYGADLARIGACGSDCVRALVENSYRAGQGGGYIGGWLYQALVNNFTEIGGFVLLLMSLTCALMLLTRLSMAELAAIAIGMTRGLRLVISRQAAKRRARQLQLAEASPAMESADVHVSKPAAARLPGMQRVRQALPSPSSQTMPLPMRLRQLFTRRVDHESASVETRNTERQEQSVAASTARSEPVFGRVFGRRQGPASAESPAADSAGSEIGAKRADSKSQAGAADAIRKPPSRQSRPAPPAFAMNRQPAAPPVIEPPPPVDTPQAPDSPSPAAISNAPAPKPAPAKPAPESPQTDTLQSDWQVPDFRALLTGGSRGEMDQETLSEQARVIEDTLRSFGAPGEVVETNTGPVITQFGVQPLHLEARKGGKRSRVKVSAIAQLDKDLQLALGAKSIRIEAPVPGKGYVGIEVPNPDSAMVSLRDVMVSRAFQGISSPLAIALGKSVDGNPVSADLTGMPHLLIAGTTGSGKSKCINAIIISILANRSPDEVKFIMVDPKRVELTGYNGLPHLVAPVVVELERTVGVLRWVTREMDQRYKTFSKIGARNIIDFNHIRPPDEAPMPYIVVIIDELADLMMTAPEETERAISRIAALARATGIHLVIATQRPSVDVVTGLIKANFPARIAFAVAGSVDSRVILDQPGAERLLGKGDMLYLSGDAPAPVRMQGVFVSDEEINLISRFWKLQGHGIAPAHPISLPSANDASGKNAKSRSSDATPLEQPAFWELEPDADLAGLGADQVQAPEEQEDELYQTAVEMVRRLEKASISLLQRRLRIGYGRAARLMDMLEDRGVVGPPKEGSSKPRDVLPPTG